jgi:hypothetical protein
MVLPMRELAVLYGGKWNQFSRLREHLFTFVHSAGTKPRFRRDVWSWPIRETTVVGRNYFKRQATMLLKFAKSTNNSDLAAVLVERAADLKSQVDESGTPDPTPRAPDIEPPPGK